MTSIQQLQQVDAKANLVTEPLDVQDGVYIMFVNEFIILFHSRWDGSKKWQRGYNPDTFPVNLAVADGRDWRSMVRSAVEMALGHWARKHQARRAVQQPKPRWKI